MTGKPTLFARDRMRDLIDRKVRTVLPNKHPGPTVKEICELTGLHIGSVRPALKRMERSNRARRRLYIEVIMIGKRRRELEINRWIAHDIPRT